MLTQCNTIGPDGRCFLAAWAEVNLFIDVKNDRPKSKPTKTEGYPPIPMFSVIPILTVVMLTAVTMTTVRTVSTWLAGQVLIVLPSYIMRRTPPAFTLAAGTLAPIWI